MRALIHSLQASEVSLMQVLKVGALSIEGRDGAQQASLFWAVLSR